MVIAAAQAALLGATGILAACGSAAPAALPGATASHTASESATASAATTATAQTATGTQSTAAVHASAASTTATSASAAAAQPAHAGTTLQVSSWLVQQPSLAAYKQLFADYAKVQPSVTLSQQVISTDYASKLTALLAGGTPPDLAETNWEESQALAGKGALQSLDSRLSLDKIAFGDYIQTALEMGRWPQQTGKYWAWYTMFATSPLYYNTALFQAAGEAPPDETWTWQHLVDVAKRLTKPNANPQAAQYGFDLTYFTRTMLYSFGWDFTSPDFSQCLLGSQQSLDAVQFWQDLIYKAQVSPPPGNGFAKGVTDGPFATNRLGMQIQGSYFIERYRLDQGLEWDVAIPPSGPAGRFAVIKGAPGHSLPTQSPHADQAWAFLSWWIKNQTPDQVVLPGNMPSKRSALTSYTAQQTQHNPVPAHIALVEQIATKYGKPIQVLPDDTEAIDPYAKQLALILANKEDVHTGMAQACQAMMGIIKQAQQ
jgi:multiple sugar transport system substrate-binding protein